MQTSLQQHPVADIFEQLKLASCGMEKACTEGQVKAEFNKEIGKNVIVISGATSASNYLQLPKSKTKSSLGLVAKYLYVQLKTTQEKQCVLHFDLKVNDARCVRLSISNTFREFSIKDGMSIQIPLTTSTKWTVMVVDLKHYLEQANAFGPNQPCKYELRSFQLHSSVAVRGVYTSDILYNATNLPACMKFKKPADNDWFKDYAWLSFPPQQVNADLTDIKENTDQSNKQKSSTSSLKKRPESASGKINLKKAKVQFATKSEKDSQIEEENKEEGNQNKQTNQRGKIPKVQKAGVTSKKAGTSSSTQSAAAPDKSSSVKDQKSKSSESQKAESAAAQFEEEWRSKQEQQVQLRVELENRIIEERKDSVEMTMNAIAQIKQEYDHSLQSKNIRQDADVLLYQREALYDPNKSQKRNCQDFILKPNPIMALDRVVGVHPRFTSKQVFFNQDPKLASELLYTQANLMLGYHPDLDKQRLFLDKNQTSISYFIAVKSFAVTFCHIEANTSIGTQHNKPQKDVLATIWDLESNQKPVFMFRPPLSEFKQASLSLQTDALSLNGKDFQGRELILVYDFNELVKYQRVELLARQLCDFDLVSLRFSEVVNNCLIGCGKENIRFFKIKNNFLPSQLVSLNNTARGKTFTHSVTNFKLINDPKTGRESKKATSVYVTTDDGLLYFINYFSRQVDKIIQIHDDPVQSIVMAPPKEGETIPFFLTASKSGNLRIWDDQFEKLVSEVSLSQQIAHCDISSDQKKIGVMSADGTLSLLELESSSFRVLMRSHTDEIENITHNILTGTLVSIGRDSSVKVWHSQTMEQIHEFNTSTIDPPISIASSKVAPLAAVGFKSGFLRLFNLEQKKVVHETMIFESSVMDLAFSSKGNFISAFFKNGKIVIIKISDDEYIPVKNIDYEFPNSNYFSLDFSPNDALLANISSNANTITVWETRNFSLKHLIDLTGDVILKLQFAPNGKDLLVLTTTSKLKIMRLPDSISSEVEIVREQFGITDKEATDFQIAPNGKFIFVCGKENLIRVYDYFLRGKLIASMQAFTGHTHFPRKIMIQNDMRAIYSLGQNNGIYKWAFYGDQEMPDDISTMFEKTQQEIALEEQKEKEILLPTFDNQKLSTYTEQQIAEMRQRLVSSKDKSSNAPIPAKAYEREGQDLLKDGGISLKRAPRIEYTPSGYVYEQHDLELQKVLGCSIAPKVKQNLFWDRKRGHLCYTMQNILIFEELSVAKTQSLKNVCNDPIYTVKLSPNQALMLAFTRFGTIDGYPQIIVWDANTRRKISHIVIEDHELVSVEFSNSSNLLLVVSFNGNQNHPVSKIAVWDFLEGRKDYLAQSVVPMKILDSRWNPYIKTSCDEFVTISEFKYHYWQLPNNLQIRYQEGDLPKGYPASCRELDKRITCLSFIEPMYEQNSVYMCIGLSEGTIWVIDTRCNSCLYQTKILECAVSKIISSTARIIVEGVSDTKIRAWELNKTIADIDYDASDPNYFFAGKEQSLTLDGFPSASDFDETAAQAIYVSTNGSFWLLNFIEGLTVKLKSCHSPEYPLQTVDFKYVSPNQFQPQQTRREDNSGTYEFDQNYLVASSGKDGVLKVWNMFDLEHCMNFFVPKEECLAIAAHQFEPYLVCSFTDGYIRFFDMQESKNMGRCLISSPNEEPDPNKPNQTKPDAQDFVISLKILPSGKHILCATKNGQVILIHVEKWRPLAITLENLVAINTSIHQFDISFLEPYNKWLVASANGKVIVYNRQDCNAFKQELFERGKASNFIFMDSFNVLEYVENCFTETKKINTLDHYYSLAKRNLVYNEKQTDHETEAIFLNNDLASYLCYVRKSQNFFIRNFELHQVVKRIEVPSLIKQVCLMPGSLPYVLFLTIDNSLRMLDFVNEANQTEIQTIHDSVHTLKVCPNGRYVITGGDKGDIILYSIKRRRPEQGVELVNQLFNPESTLNQREEDP